MAVSARRLSKRLIGRDTILAIKFAQQDTHVQLIAEQDYLGVKEEPDHKGHQRTDGAIDFIVMNYILYQEEEYCGEHYAEQCSKDSACRDEAESSGKGRPVSIDHTDNQEDH